jgi:hypothetical protein
MKTSLLILTALTALSMLFVPFGMIMEIWTDDSKYDKFPLIGLILALTFYIPAIVIDIALKSHSL